MNHPIVYINARFLTQQITGVQRFAIEICKELRKNNNIRIQLLCPKNIVHNKIAQDLEARVIGNFTGHKWEQITLAKFMLGKRKDLLISLCNTGPLIIKNQIVTIHDLCFKLHPEWFSKGFSLWYNFIIPIIAKKSKHIITVSKSSKDEIIKFLNISSEKVSVVYNGISNVFRNENLNLEGDSKLNYILTVSSHHPRKNFGRLINAFHLINDKDINLFVIGNSNKHFVNDLTKYKFSDRIKFLDNISDNELASFYKNARLFVFPSLYEGFGIPIIEAVINGACLCVSNIPVFKEICLDNALYFDPMDEVQMAKMIEKSLKKPIIPDKCFFLENYSWEKSSLKIIEVISNI